MSLLAYCLLVTLKNLAQPQVSGLTARTIINAYLTIQMVDVHLPTTDGRHLYLPRFPRPNTKLAMGRGINLHRQNLSR